MSLREFSESSENGRSFFCPNSGNVSKNHPIKYQKSLLQTRFAPRFFILSFCPAAVVGMPMIFYWSCLALLDQRSVLLTLCVALLLVESRHPDHFFELSQSSPLWLDFFCLDFTQRMAGTYSVNAPQQRTAISLFFSVF